MMMNRHGKASYVSFVDDHVDPVELKDIWTLKWHRKFGMTADKNVTTGISVIFGNSFQIACQKLSS